MVNIKTSYFAKYRGDDGISIARSKPSFYHCPDYDTLKPYWSLISRYKRNGDEQAYIREYNTYILNKLSPEHVARDLNDKVLLCWEKPGKFCHRHIVAEWLENSLNIKVVEI